jgi:hypothetical protein
MINKISAGLAGVATAGLMLAGMSAPAVAQTSAPDYMLNALECLGLLITDPTARAECGGTSPTGGDSLAPTGTEEAAPDVVVCVTDLRHLAPGERVRIAAAPCPVPV